MNERATMFPIRIHLALLSGLLTSLFMLACGAERPSVEAEPTVEGPPGTHVYVVNTPYNGVATASLEERIYMADVVVKARLQSARNDVLSFRAIAYLKGTGPGNFTVRAKTAGRDTQWDNQDAILFLNRLTGESENFRFIDTTFWGYNITSIAAHEYTGVLPEGYSLGRRNPVWLPAGSGSDTSSSRSLPSGSIIIEYDGNTPVVVTESELKGEIRWLTRAATSSPVSGQSSGTSKSNTATQVPEGYQACIKEAVNFIRLQRDWEAYYNRPFGPSYDGVSFDSNTGMGEPVVVYGYQYSPEYDIHSISGSDAHLFKVQRGDHDNNPENGYKPGVVTTRPLPAGTYTFNHRVQPWYSIPCDFQPEGAYTHFTVWVTAPPGTIHEAFFDPATTTVGVGYFTGATTTGVLKPAAFSTGSASTTITGLKWKDGEVVLSLSPFVSLGDHQLEFIDLDGSTAFALRAPDATADSAAGTLTWDVPDRPWSAGDLLMLRIGPAPDSAPAPLDVSVSLSDDALTISWNAVADASLYRVQRRTDGASEWTSLSAATTTQALSPEGGLSCGATYEFRLQARGDGETYLASWGLPSESVSHTTAACNLPPAFATSTYAFSVSEDAATSTTVATVSATDPDGDAVSYSITAGNDGGAFSIDGGGSIAVAAPLDYEAVSSYTLTVQAVDGRGGAATSTVNVAVTDVAEIPPPAPQNLSATSTHASVTLSWDAPDDPSATGYQILRRRPLEGERTLLVHVADTGSAQTTYTDTDVTPDTQYAYRVKAINAAGPGPVSNFVNLTTPAQP